MKLLTKAIRKRMPKLYATDGEADPIMQVKFFAPWSRWTWYAKEGEPILDDEGNEVDYHFFGFVFGLDPTCDEWGYFSLNELESVVGLWGLKIERDLHFEPKRASEIKGIKLYGKDDDE